MSLSPLLPLRAEYDVAVVGLGPIGGTLANLLALRGLAVLVLDRDADIYNLPRAVQFDGECMRVFQTIGIAAEMSPHLLAVPGMRFVDAQGHIIIDWSRPMDLGPHGWHASYRFHQPDLETALRRHLACFPKVDVRLRHEVFALDEQPGHVQLRFENMAAGQLLSARAKYVVGCDGARSMVRRLMGTELEDLKSHDRWLVVDVLLNEDHPELGDYAIQYCGTARPATYIRGIGLRRRWEFMLPADVNPATVTQPETIWAMLDRWLTPEQARIERSAVYTFHSVLAKGWRQGRLLIAGDAAHQTPPFMGQGMCAGVRDAANLAWKLDDIISGAADDTLLDTYEAERAPHARIFIEEAVRLGHVIRDTDETISRGKQAPQEKFVTPQPRLGGGAHLGCGHAGAVSEQPLLASGQRLDQLAGYDSILLAAPALAEAARVFDRTLKIATADSPASRDYLDRLGVRAVLIRPDRYIYGTASSNDELEDELARFHGLMRPQHAA